MCWCSLNSTHAIIDIVIELCIMECEICEGACTVCTSRYSTRWLVYTDDLFKSVLVSAYEVIPFVFENVLIFVDAFEIVLRARRKMVRGEINQVSKLTFASSLKLLMQMFFCFMPKDLKTHSGLRRSQIMTHTSLYN